jgi:hypothetical protein
MDQSATNYHPGANTPEDGSQGTPCTGGQTVLTNTFGCNCVYPVFGCTDNTSILVDGSNGTHPDTNGFGTDAIYDCSSATPNIPTNIGTINTCPHPCGNGYWANNYNPCASVAITCTGDPGCMNLYANNYNANAYTDDGSCTFGCCSTSFTIAFHELRLSLAPANSCTTSSGGVNYTLTIIQPDLSTYTDPNNNNSYLNFTGTLNTTTSTTLVIDESVIAAQGDGEWKIEITYNFPNTTIPACTTILTQNVIVGCTDNTPGPNPDINGNCNTGAPCNTLGCCGGTTGYSAEQFNPLATVNDGSCTHPIFGCTDSGTVHPTYTNFTNNSSSAAENYDPTATVDDGSCLYRGCTTANNGSGGIASNYFAYYNLDCNGEPIGTNNPGYDSCCNFGTTGCTNSAAGCHPDINGYCNDGAGYPTYAGSTSCSGSFCCVSGTTSYGYKKINYDPACDADPNCTLGGCQAVVNQGCGIQTHTWPGASNTPTYNYDPCVTTIGQTQWCIPVIQGCMDPTALNYGSYSQNNPFGSHSNNTWFGTTAPFSSSGNTWNYAGNPTAAQTSQYGHHGPNTPSGPAGCGGVNWATNPCNDCVYAEFGCMDDGAQTWSPNPGTPANNYDTGATVNQISQTNTNSPCCYDSGCVMPNALAVLPAGSLPDITATNIGSAGCALWISSGGTSGSLSACYGNMVDVSNLTIDGDANGTTVGNGWQHGNNNIPIALNGGNTCADHNCDTGNVGTAVWRLQNQDGYFDPGGHGTNGLNAAGQQLTTVWTNWNGQGSFVSSGVGPGQFNAEDCCDYEDGCSDPCAQNFNPGASTAPSAQTCSFGTISGGWTTTNPPPWQDSDPCTTLPVS